MSKLGSQLPHKIIDSRSQNRNINLIFDRILFYNIFYIIYTYLKRKNTNMTLICEKSKE